MKTLILFLVMVLPLAVSAQDQNSGQLAEKPTELFTYLCGEKSVVVRSLGDKFSLKIILPSVLTKNFTIPIMSEPLPVGLMQLVFNGGIFLGEEEEGWPETGLPKDSLAFVGFRYMNGDLYMKVFDQLNEDGYTFTAEQGLLKGQAFVKGAEAVAVVGKDPQITQLSCRLVR